MFADVDANVFGYFGQMFEIGDALPRVFWSANLGVRSLAGLFLKRAKFLLMYVVFVFVVVARVAESL